MISEIIRRPDGLVARQAVRRRKACCTSIIVVAEVEFGLCKQPSERRQFEVRTFLETLPILSWQSPSDRRYAEIRNILERDSTPIGANDLLIAAHAVALGATLVTANERECRIPGLTVENWAA